MSINDEELRKLKGLLDDGVITQEEFDTKKKELLNYKTPNPTMYNIEAKPKAKPEEKTAKDYVKVGCLGFIAIFIVLILIGVLSDQTKVKDSVTSGSSSSEQPQKDIENKTPDLPAVFDANRYGGVTEQSIVNEWGQPQDTDSFGWDSNGEGYKYQIKTLIYKKDNIEYEFWLYGNKVVRIGIDNENGFEFSEKNQLSILSLDAKKYRVKDINVATDFIPKEHRDDSDIPQKIKYLEVQNGKTKIIKIIYNTIVAG